MTVFDLLRYPTSQRDLVHGDTLDRLPVPLRNQWWFDISSDEGGVYNRLTVDTVQHMKWWIEGLNRTRFAKVEYKLKEHIAKWGE